MLSDLIGKAKLVIDEGDSLPEVIPNSTLQLDGDISCYYSAWTDMPVGACINQLKKHIETKRLLAGCEIVNVHTTHGSKAGREEIAMVQEYQCERSKNKDPEKSARVAELRNFLQTYETATVKPVPSFEVEADDMMNIMQRIEIDLGHYSAICTKDKDLNMCPGNHFDYDSMESYVVPDGYGKLFVVETQKPAPTKRGFKTDKKVVGHGTCFLWCQMLMGDRADWIPGVPRISGKLLNKYLPIKKTLAANKCLANPKATQAKKTKAYADLAARNSATLGQITAYELLKNCKTDIEAMQVVHKLYIDYYGRYEFDFETWRGDTITVGAGAMMLEQARLLWMLRTFDDDVLKFFSEVRST